MGRIPLDSSAVAWLTVWRDQPGMLGVRVTLHRDPWRAAFQRGDLDWLWASACDADLPIMVYAPGLSAHLGAVARRYPALRLIVDHLAIPVSLSGAEVFADLPELLALAQFPPVAVKATALPCHSRLGFPFPDLHQPLRQVFEQFGPHRMFWAVTGPGCPAPTARM